MTQLTLHRFIACLTLVVGITACTLSRHPAVQEQPLGAQNVIMTAATPSVGAATETIPPYTPLATLTPSQTLKPPPTFEPPTATVAPSMTPTITPTTPAVLNVSIPGLRGAESPTPSTTPGCKARGDWKLRYTVQRDDALERIAQRYSTSVDELAVGNCLTDPNLIVIGQELRVPGATQPEQPAVQCIPWEVLTPMNGTVTIEGSGQLTFNWRGPRAPRNLIRVIKPDGSLWERTIELRQNESVDLYEEFPQAGTYTWLVFPLDSNFVQVSCKEGGPWTFTKAPAPTPTPTLTASAGGSRP